MNTSCCGCCSVCRLIRKSGHNVLALVALGVLITCVSGARASAQTPSHPPVAAPSADALTPVKPLKIDIATKDGAQLTGELIAAGNHLFKVRTKEGERTVAWHQLSPRVVYDVHVKLLEGATADDWLRVARMLRGMDGGHEFARACYAKSVELSNPVNREMRATESKHYARVIETIKVLERISGRSAKALPVASVNERIWYDAPQFYETHAKHAKKLAQLLADHLATANALLVHDKPRMQRLGLGLANAVADGMARHLERAAAAADVVESLVLPNLDLADDQSQELSRQMLLGTAIYVFRLADMHRRQDDACRLLLKHAPNKNAANAAKYLLGQSLAKQEDLVGAISILRDVRGTGVNSQELNMLVSKYRRQLIGDTFQVDVMSNVPHVGSCPSPFPYLPLQTLNNAHTREDIWYMAARVQAEVTGPIHFQVGLTNGWCTFQGTWTPAENGMELWMFSDDGCDVYIDGVARLERRKKGQKLTSWREHDWSPSLHQVSNPTPFVANTTYNITIYYADLYYMNYTFYTDIDGATLFAIGGANSLALVDLPGRISVNRPVTLRAKAQNKNQTPSIGKVVEFKADGVTIGTAVTLADGIASIVYTPTSMGIKNFSVSLSQQHNTTATAADVPFSTDYDRVRVVP